MIRQFLTSFATLFALTAPVAMSAQSGSDVITGHLIPGWEQPDGSRIVGLSLDLAPGWKTYWRAPGDAGIPPRFDWRGSRNLGAIRVIWPTPKLMDQNGMLSVGYPHDVVLPLVIRPKSEGKAVTMKAEIELGVCKDICVPAKVRVSGQIPDGPGTRNPAIVAALVDQPMSASEARVGKVTCDVSPTRDGMQLRAEIRMPSAGAPEFAIVETSDPRLWVAEAETRRTGGALVAQTTISHVEGKPFALNRSDLRITVLGRDHAVDIRGCKGS